MTAAPIGTFAQPLIEARESPLPQRLSHKYVALCKLALRQAQGERKKAKIRSC